MPRKCFLKQQNMKHKICKVCSMWQKKYLAKLTMTFGSIKNLRTDKVISVINLSVSPRTESEMRISFLSFLLSSKAYSNQ